MELHARSKAANGPPLSATVAYLPSQPMVSLSSPCAAAPFVPRATPAFSPFPGHAPVLQTPPGPLPSPPPSHPSRTVEHGPHQATPKIQPIAESSAKSGVSPVPITLPAEHAERRTPTSPSGLSLTVKGIVGEYRLEAQSIDHAGPIVYLMDRIMTVESNLAQQRLQDQQFQNQQLQWQMWSSMPQMCNMLASGSDQPLPCDAMQTVSSVNDPIVSNQNTVDRPPLKRVKVNTLKPGECKHTSDDGEFSSFYLPQGKTAFKFLQRFTVGRNGEEVVELQHPILRKCFVIPCIAGFTCTTLLQNESDKVDWGQVYYALVLRVRSDIVLTKQRVQNALVLQKVRVTASKFVPNLDYFSPSRGFLTEPQLSMVSGPLTEFFLQKIQAQLQEKGKNMTPTIRFGCALLCKAFTIHADNTELFEEVLVHFRDKDVPFALTVELKSFPFQLLEGTMDTKSKYAFAHNCSLLTACGILEDGCIRPSAVDESDTDWLPVPGFYCRGAMIQGNDPKAEKASMIAAMVKAAKYSHCQDGNKPLSIVGVAHSRQHHHITVHQGGVVAEQAASFFYDAVHGQGDKRWCFKSHLCTLQSIATYVDDRHTV